MLKRFFISFLGSLAGFMVAGFIGLIVIIVVIASAASKGSETTVSLKKGSVLKIEFDGNVVDREQPTPLIDLIKNGDEKTIALNDLVKAIDRAADDKNIEGIYLECKGASAGMAQIQALRNAIKRFKESGKWVYANADNYVQGNYFLATAADSVFVNPQGMVDIHGLSSTVMYFKDLLEKVGVEVQVVKVGTYKSAVEPFLLNDMSEANREQMSLLLGNMWNEIVAQVCEDRGVDSTAVNGWANSFCFSKPASDYVTEKIVDKTIYKHEIDERIAKLTDNDEPNYITYSDYLKASTGKSSKGAKIAVLYATGDITEDGDDGIASERLVPEIMDLCEDEDIDGLIMRVNSGGGSAYASEQIWEALEQFKARTGKPFYVSMGDYAASGGYYISCGADRIYAEPLTLTGSIGIFGMIPDAQELLNKKIGINTATVATNTGEFPTYFKAMTPEQVAAMQGYVDRGYELFTSRCAAGRKMSVEDIKKIAEGRVWDGRMAMQLGLVDKMGGLEIAIKDMAAALNSGKDTDGYRITEFPKVKFEWYEELFKLNSQIKTRAINNELGEAARYYHAIKNIGSMSPLQCRMEFIEIR